MPVGNDGLYRANPQQARNAQKQDTADPGKGKLRCIRIEPAKNGFAVYEERESTKKPTKDMPFPPYEPPEPAVFTDKKQLIEYVEKCLG
ncbi:MAG TPA: hypothetical protein VGK24_05740 [Candidatus Angelobacter sp.]|jgi:hypothetical protein